MLNLLRYRSKAQLKPTEHIKEAEMQHMKVPPRSFTFPFLSSSDLISLVRFPFFEEILCNSESTYYWVLFQNCQNLGIQWRDLPSEHLTKTSKGDKSLLFIYFTEVPASASIFYVFLLITSNTNSPAMVWYAMVGVKKDSAGISTVHPWKAQDGPFCPFQSGHPDRWHLVLKPKLNSQKCLRQDSNSGRISYGGSLPTSLCIYTCLHSLSHFSLSGLQTTTLPNGLKYIYIYYFLIVTV